MEWAPIEATNRNEGARCGICGSIENVEYYKERHWIFGEWRCDEHRRKVY